MPEKFILIEPDPIVCIDLKGALQDRYPDSQIIASDDAQRARRLIEDGRVGTTIFVKASLIDQHSDLAQSIADAAALGCNIVTFGRTEGLAAPAKYVDLPFSTEMLMEAITPATP